MSSEKVEQKLSRLKRKIEEIERNVLHSVFPRDPKQLYLELVTHQKKLLELKTKKRVLSQEQYDLLFPASQQTNSEEFDTTLLGVLLRSVCGFKTNGYYSDHFRFLCLNFLKTYHKKFYNFVCCGLSSVFLIAL